MPYLFIWTFLKRESQSRIFCNSLSVHRYVCEDLIAIMWCVHAKSFTFSIDMSSVRKNTTLQYKYRTCKFDMTNIWYMFQIVSLFRNKLILLHFITQFAHFFFSGNMGIFFLSMVGCESWCEFTITVFHYHYLSERKTVDISTRTLT